MKTIEIKEYILWVDSDKLEISFKPSKKSKFGFINAIEVISAPKDLISDIAQVIDSNGVVKIDGISKNAYETMFRVNVGGVKVTPFNDSLWRTWVTDDGFLESNQESKKVHFSGRIKYRMGGASREVAPDNVYNSARVISASNSGVAKYELTWGFPIVDGYKYLVRFHFCDIASSVLLGSLYFNVRVNGRMAIEDLDLSTITNSLASPYYADFVVSGENGVITVSIGPSNSSSSSGVDALLNGIEVFKMSNSMDSLDGMVSVRSIMKECRGRTGGFLVPLVAAVGLLVAASMVLRKRLMGARDSVAWSPLPVDVSEVSLKSSY
ncbi:probable receptor-like protein kinase At5g24010 [Beta vulgaris subsp. vulgaris]|uniref:probable receptor-like protein kinase At5g24010 n=1 Tax=Beta vulgaris subsp. vulgaris TaxID=3555 RepID=UPI0020373016|nr:probable receptor-like protein kinase At5g24010 [Beta vulgaris subsp. vulgaris]